MNVAERPRSRNRKLPNEMVARLLRETRRGPENTKLPNELSADASQGTKLPNELSAGHPGKGQTAERTPGPGAESRPFSSAAVASTCGMPEWKAAASLRTTSSGM